MFNYGILGIVKVSTLPKENLIELYLNKKKSVSYIAHLYRCSENKVNYWLKRYKINKRTISEAIYQIKNPNGDPFSFKRPKSLRDSVLFGLGLGLYWGEGSKRGTGGVRLTNTDPRMVAIFIKFLKKIFNIDERKLRFSLQTFGDIDSEEALNYWVKSIGVAKSQFYKIIVSKVRGAGSYKNKSKHGVLIVYFNNIKLKRMILEMIEKV